MKTSEYRLNQLEGVFEIIEALKRLRNIRG